MRLLPLKILDAGTFYRNGPNAGPNAPVLDVPDGEEYNPITMFKQTFNYRETIKSIVRNPPPPPDPRSPAVMDYEQVRQSVVILDAIAQTPELEILELKDEEWAYLNQRVRGTGWTSAMQAVLTFVDDIQHATTCKPENVGKVKARLKREMAGESDDDDESGVDGAKVDAKGLDDKIMATAPQQEKQPVTLASKRNGRAKAVATPS